MDETADDVVVSRDQKGADLQDFAYEVVAVVVFVVNENHISYFVDLVLELHPVELL